MYTNSSSYICNIFCINFCQSKKAVEAATEAAKKTAPVVPPVVKIHVLVSAMLVRTINFFSETSLAEVFHCGGC